MINYDTIISNFDDKVTLYNWLHKVEEALKNASATNFVVNKKGNATLSFSITFADGETIESGDIVLQQGESVDQARIASGVLQLHLTNGTWLSAGNIKPVNNFSIDANQHLIVNYQDNTSQDLGAIFNGNVVINGTITANKFIGVTEMETIKDSENNNRFINGNILLGSDAVGLTKVFGRYTLSGTHLQIVALIHNETENDITLTTFKLMAYCEVPIWVADKIYPLPNATAVEVKTFDIGNTSNVLTIKAGKKFFLEKAGTQLRILTGESITLQPKDFVRISFDLIIE